MTENETPEGLEQPEDDVEAHGVKEVVTVGMTAAALAGAGATGAKAANVASPATPATPAASQAYAMPEAVVAGAVSNALPRPDSPVSSQMKSAAYVTSGRAPAMRTSYQRPMARFANFVRRFFPL